MYKFVLAGSTNAYAGWAGNITEEALNNYFHRPDYRLSCPGSRDMSFFMRTASGKAICERMLATCMHCWRIILCLLLGAVPSSAEQRREFRFDIPEEDGWTS